MPTAKELLNYRDQLNTAVQNQSSEIYFNDSILHAMIIMKEIFNKASVENRKKVCMFCGNFSLFRDETKEKIANEKNHCSLDGLNANEMRDWANIDFYNDLRDAFLAFLDHADASFELILQSGINTLKDMSIWELLENENLMRKIKVYASNFDIGLDHFVVTSDAYRVENSDTIKTATCCFNDKESANVLNDCFKELVKFSKPLSIM